MKKIFVYMISSALILSGCVTNTGTVPSFDVGPKLSSFLGQKHDYSQDANRPKLDVIIPVFDPGLPTDTSQYVEKGIWPELRRAEATRFAMKLKSALEATDKFGAVRVTPDKTATGDLYILGRIDESNGEDVDIEIEVYDISGKKWIDTSFDHEVESTFHTDIRNHGTDPYDPVFEDAAHYIVEELNDHKSEELVLIKQLTSLRFGANFSETAFAPYMETNGDLVKLLSMPNDDDPMLKRTLAIRVRDQLFVDRLQNNYESFIHKMDDSYYMWQEQSFLEIEAERAAKRKAAGEAIAGVALIGLAVLAAAAGGNSNSYSGQAAASTTAVVAGAVGANLISESFQTSEEAKIHRDALTELGQSVDMELAPQVIKFDEQTLEITGNAQEQFAQWRAFLKQVSALESTPSAQL